MQVRTLIRGDFDKACIELANKIKSDFSPDIIIGVLTGGGYVGRKVFASKAFSHKPKYFEMKIQRELTKQKEKTLIHKILTSCPYFILNWLRMIELTVIVHKAKKHNPKREGNIALPTEIEKVLKEGEKNVVIIDDAIDTGATINLIKEHIEQNYPSNKVKVAVITVTTNTPIIDADYYLYHNRTLVRFPWSNDLKRNEKSDCY